MNQLNSNTQRQKDKHLSFEERVIIQTRLNDKHSPNKIAAELGCSPNTIRNEIKRSTVYLYNAKVTRYKAEAGQKAYEENRANSCRRCEYINKLEFIAHIENSFFELCISATTIFQRKYLVDLSSKECEKTRSYSEGQLKKDRPLTTN